MNYFKGLAVIFGIIAFLKPFIMHVIPWDENKFIQKAYSKKRPKWIVPVAIIGIILVVFTWYKYFTTDVQYAIILAILFSLTAIKAIVFIFDYEKFYKWIQKMINKENGKDIVLIDIGAGIFGLLLILLGIFIY